MHLERYPVEANETFDKYEFFSKGPNGVIKKEILYEQMGPKSYNLAFGDWSDARKTINAGIITNNGDRDKVLATVASTIFSFVEHHPDAVIFARGNTPAKTRLYQMGISRHWYLISRDFYISGLYNGIWESFKLGKNYEGFFLEARKNI